MTSSSGELPLGGFALQSMTKEALNLKLAQQLASNRQCALFFANTNFIVQCQGLREQISGSNSILVNDGIGLDIAGWLVHHCSFPENLNGTDYIPQFLAEIKDQARVFLLGGKPGIAVRAANTLVATHGVNVVGTANGYEDAKDSGKLVETMNASNANIVLVAMGNPAQEAWILRHQPLLNARLFFGVGALLDFLAGDKPRAPPMIRRLRLEWLYRLSLEPKRLLRRYTWDIFVFLRLCLSHQDAANQ